LSNLRLITINQTDLATLSALPAAVATLPVTNLQNDMRARVMRSTSTADQQILGDLPSPDVADGISLARHNFSTQATVQVRLFDGVGQTGSCVYDSGAVDVVEPIAVGVFRVGIDAWGAKALPYADIWTHWFPAVAYRSFEITISDGGNVDGYLQAGRLFLGLSLSPSSNFDWGSALEFIEDTRQESTAGGTLRSEGGNQRRRFPFDLSLMSPSDRERFVNELRRVGMMKTVLISAYPGAGGALEADHTLVAKMSSAPRYSTVQGGYFQSKFVFDEA